jgi:hypothetical protein
MKNTSELWFQTGLITSTKDCRRYIPVHELCRSLSSVPNFPSLQPCSRGDQTAGFGNHIFVWYEDLRTCCLNVSSLGGSLTKVESLTLSNFILPADHALTGCDTTSSIFGIGKKSMFKALKELPNQFSDLSRIA